MAAATFAAFANGSWAVTVSASEQAPAAGARAGVVIARRVAEAARIVCVWVALVNPADAAVSTGEPARVSRK